MSEPDTTSTTTAAAAAHSSTFCCSVHLEDAHLLVEHGLRYCVLTNNIGLLARQQHRPQGLFSKGAERTEASRTYDNRYGRHADCEESRWWGKGSLPRILHFLT